MANAGGVVLLVSKLDMEAGGVGIDTAYGYRDQDNISRGLATLKVSRPDVFILSKIDPNTTMVRPPHSAAVSCC